MRSFINCGRYFWPSIRWALVKTNEEFFKWLTGEKTMPFGENNRHVPVRLIDFDDLTNNRYVVTNQYRIHHRETKIPDIVLLINGIPVVVGEAKTPIRPSVSWLDGAHEIHDIYENSVPQLFVPNILSLPPRARNYIMAPSAVRWNTGRPGGWKMMMMHWPNGWDCQK
jgi:hypothetical protein